MSEGARGTLAAVVDVVPPLGSFASMPTNMGWPAAGGGRGLTFFAATDGRGLVGRDAAFSLRVTLGGGGGSGSAEPVGASTSTAAAASLREESRCSAFDSFARKSSAPATAFNGAGDCFFSGSAAFIASSCARLRSMAARCARCAELRTTGILAVAG